MKNTIKKNTLTIKDFCTNHNDKMENMISISTSPMVNRLCPLHAACKNAVCGDCYSRKMAKRFTNLDKKLIRNYELLRSQIIAVADMPILNASICRIEAFGDIDNINQVVNYFNLCKRNKNTTFAMWTKNPAIINTAIKTGNAKPKNLIIIQSSLYKNICDPVKYDFIDKTFTVWNDQETAAKNGIKINCGKLHCINCQKCYKKNTTKIINELLK